MESLDLTLAKRELRRGEHAVVFLHGIGNSKADYSAAEAAPALESFSIVAFDLLGFGDSPKPVDFSYSVDDHAAAVVAAIRSLTFPHIHLVGHSVGGAIGVVAAHTLGAALRSFISVEGNLIGADCGMVTRRTASVPFAEYEQLHWPERRASLLARGASVAAHDVMSREAFYKTAQSIVGWSDSGRLLQYFLQLPVPTLYVYGAENRSAPVLAELRGVPCQEIPAAGHRPMEENPQQFYAASAA